MLLHYVVVRGRQRAVIRGKRIKRKQKLICVKSGKKKRPSAIQSDIESQRRLVPYKFFRSLRLSRVFTPQEGLNRVKRIW